MLKSKFKLLSMPTNCNVSETDRNWSIVLTFRRYKQHWDFLDEMLDSELCLSRSID